MLALLLSCFPADFRGRMRPQALSLTAPHLGRHGSKSAKDWIHVSQGNPPSGKFTFVCNRKPSTRGLSRMFGNLQPMVDRGCALVGARYQIPFDEKWPRPRTCFFRCRCKDSDLPKLSSQLPRLFPSLPTPLLPQAFAGLACSVGGLEDAFMRRVLKN